MYIQKSTACIYKKHKNRRRIEAKKHMIMRATYMYVWMDAFMYVQKGTYTIEELRRESKLRSI